MYKYKENRMTRLIEAAQSLKNNVVVEKSVMASGELGISKSVAVRWLSSNEFYHVEINVDKLPLSTGDMIASADAPKHMIIVDINKNKVNPRASIYVPKVSVVCGGELVRGAKKKGTQLIHCWIGAKAAKALKIKLPKISANLAQLSKAGFNPHQNGPALGTVSLPTNAMNNVSMSFPDFRNFGAPGSELNNPQFMSMLNIEEALDMYLGNLKDGIWKPISSQWTLVPPSLIDATNEAGLIAKDRKLAASTFSPIDFVYWQQHVLNQSIKHKIVNGSKLSASKFAFVGDDEDPSTWLFRADSLPAIRASIDQVKACKYLSKEAKLATLGELKRRSQV